MRKLKIFLPSIALIVVLAFSITIGVYAASSVSFSISSTVSFYSPDLKMECEFITKVPFSLDNRRKILYNITVKYKLC